jgi:hypothetical protein
MLSELFSAALSKKIAFVAVALMAAAMLAPYLIPASLELQIGVWILYLTFFGVGAWRLYEFLVIVRKDLRSKRDTR